MKILAELFLTFAKIGLFTFGGGYAMISVIENNCVERKKWITHDEMMDMTVVAESTPGPIAINCSTFTGYRIAGFSGALAATLGIVMPSFIVIFIISVFLDNFLEITVVANAFRGIKIAVSVLILDAAVKMIKKMKKKPLPLLIMLLSVLVMLAVNIFSWSFSSVSLMLVAAAVSLAVFVLSGEGRKKGGGDR